MLFTYIYLINNWNLTSGIIIQPIVSFLEHIALAKSFSKREPQEKLLDSVSLSVTVFISLDLFGDLLTVSNWHDSRTGCFWKFASGKFNDLWGYSNNFSSFKNNCHVLSWKIHACHMAHCRKWLHMYLWCFNMQHKLKNFHFCNFPKDLCWLQQYISQDRFKLKTFNNRNKCFLNVWEQLTRIRRQSLWRNKLKIYLFTFQQLLWLALLSLLLRHLLVPQPSR